MKSDCVIHVCSCFTRSCVYGLYIDGEVILFFIVFALMFLQKLFIYNECVIFLVRYENFKGCQKLHEGLVFYKLTILVH